MTLDELMPTIAPNVIVSVGARSAYLFIGDRAEYAESIDEVSREVKAALEKKLSEVNDTVRSIQNALIPGQARRGSLSPEALRKNLADFEGRRRRLTHTIDSFRPLREREVREVYPRMHEPDGICVIVEGDENGDAWFKDEYDALRKHRRRWGK